MKLDVSKIIVGTRFRKDAGDLNALAESIAKLGLLQPIGVVPRGPNGSVELVFGERRLLACRDILGLSEIEVRPLDIGDLLEKEHDENEVRKDFTTSERVSIARAIESELKNRHGSNQHRKKEPTASISTDEEEWQKIVTPPDGRSNDIAARKAGFGNRETYRQAKAVVETGTPELVQAMDGNVVSIKAAAKLAKKPPEEQRQAVVEPAFLDQLMDNIDAELEGRKTDSRRRQEVVNAFLVVRDTRLSSSEFIAHILPAHLEDVQSALPKMRQFLAAIEGTCDAKNKSTLKTV